MTNIVPLLLAAGASSRMGQPKALLDFDGQTVLELALDAMAGLAAPVVVLGPNRVEIESRVDLSATRIGMNSNVSTGLTGSLRIGLAMLPPECEGFVFMPIDHPLVRRSDVMRLIDVARALPLKSIFIPCHEARRGHPVLCHRTLAEEILDLPATALAKEALKADPARVEHVPFESADAFMDMDSPEDYVRCLDVFRARKIRP